jgi:hypothetical protein
LDRFMFAIKLEYPSFAEEVGSETDNFRWNKYH